MKVYLRMALTVLALGLMVGFARVNAQPEENKEAEAPKKIAPEALEKSLKKVLPEFDNKVLADVKYVDDKSLTDKCDYEAGKGCKVYTAKKKGAEVGFAIQWTSQEGLKGPITILLGVTPEGDITGLDILDQSETPNRGDKITTPEFQGQFVKRNLTNTKWAIDKEKKDPGDIKAITGASFSSRAVTGAVKDVLEFFDKNKATLVKAKGK